MRDKGKIFLDTNILVYATDELSLFHERAKEIRDKAGRGKIKACMSLQVLTEFYSAVTNTQNKIPLSPEKARKEIRSYLRNDFIIKLPIKEKTVGKMVDLAKMEEVKGQNIYDVQIVATMLDNGIKRIYTNNDKDFVKFKEIEVINPFKGRIKNGAEPQGGTTYLP